MNRTTIIRMGLATRIHEVRIDRFGGGFEGIRELATALDIPPRTWMNYEDGVTMPAEIVLKLIDLTGVDHRWLLRGEGEMYSEMDFGPDTQRDG